jgi:3-hydroxyisobutyrate dehydrogenase-like beta-hydroxyacid dehydrogenase
VVDIAVTHIFPKGASMKRIGFIGLGAMGSRMARNIAKGGYALGVYNRNLARAESFRAEGAAVHATPAELAADSEAVVVMVTDPVALADVLAGEQGLLAGLRKGALVINMSTVSPEATLAAARDIEDAGGRFIDAPVSGTVKPAEEGTLVVLAAGDSRDVDAAESLLRTMGKAVVRCGAVGQATRMKLVLNLMLAGMMQALAEGLSLAESQALDGAAVLEAISGGPLAAGLYTMKGGMMLGNEFSKQFPVDLLFKDLNLVLDAAGKAHQSLPMTAAIRETFSAARALGYGDEDMAAVIKVLRRAGSGEG